MPFTALVVDDEPLARDELKYLLSTHQGCQVIGEAEDGAEALRLAAGLQPDVLFLDIEMRGMTGTEVARRLLAGPHPPLVVFATAYREHAIRAFELGAVDYLLKPFEESRVGKAIERIEGLRRRSGDWAEALQRVSGILESGLLGNSRPRVRKLPVERRGEIKLLDYDELIFAVAREGQVEMVTRDDSFTFGGTMSDLETRLEGESFLRVHKSYVVNLNRVEGVLPWFKGTYWLVMSDRNKTQVPVSKSQVKDLKAMLGMARS